MTPTSLRSGALERWWPATQSLDLARGPAEHVAAAVTAEVQRFLGDEALETGWHAFESLDSAFAEARCFATVPTFFLVLPTRSEWTVLWNNSAQFDGYDSLCWCLTRHHHLTTLHWSASDEATAFQAGAVFNHRRSVEGRLVERSVYCAREDRRWLFREAGEPLPEEDAAAYTARRKKDRLNERSMAALLERLGARPWAEDYYAVPPEPVFAIRRTRVPERVATRLCEEVLRGS